MASFYATRTLKFPGVPDEHQLLKFDNKEKRNMYACMETAKPITARDAKKLCIADTWRTYSSNSAECVFHAARYLLD